MSVRPLRVLTRLVAGAVAVLLFAGGIVACDASPTVATVDGSRIKQAQLYQLLSDARKSPAYVGLLQTVAGTTRTGAPLQLTGTGTSTYSKQLTAMELTSLITAEVIHQVVASYHEEPGPAMLQAARSTYEAVLGADGFAGMPVPFRNTLVYQLAEHAQLETPLSNTSQLRDVYNRYRADFYQQVCVQQISVVVPGATGGVDEAASASEAQSIVTSFNNAGASRIGSTLQTVINGGTTNCYTQEQMQALGSGFRSTVMGLAPGHAAPPEKASAGYTVIAVTSRNDVPDDQTTEKAITAAVLELQPLSDQAVISLLHQAHVTVSPEFGTWQPNGGGGTLPAVVPPSAPARAPGVPPTLPSGFSASS